MKIIKWKTLALTCLICLLPIVFGLLIWDKLPDSIAIHFDINNNPDNFASKQFAVFALPVMMAILQIVCCIINDVNAAKHGERIKFSFATKSIIPCLSIILQIVTFAYAMGNNIDIRKVTGIIVGIILLVIGNYMPKFDYIKNYNIDSEKAKKANRFIGFLTVIMGLIFIISSFLPPVATVIALVLIIFYALISVIYTIYLIKKKN